MESRKITQNLNFYHISQNVSDFIFNIIPIVKDSSGNTLSRVKKKGGGEKGTLYMTYKVRVIYFNNVALSIFYSFRHLFRRKRCPKSIRRKDQQKEKT